MSATKNLLTAVAALAAAVSTVAAIGGCGTTATKDSTPTSTPTAASAPASAQAAEHNQADIHFAHMMIPHHQQAIEMSDMILAKGDIDPRVVGLAEQIKAAQGPEIEQMRGWLTLWGAPDMSGMPGMHSMPGEGMMSAADMDALNNARGAQAGTLFLTQMIAHHRGAIAMAQTEITDGRFPDAVALATSIAKSQQAEIDTMNQILSSR